MRTFVLVLVVLFMPATEALAQAWTLGGGRATVSLSLGMLGASERFDEEGEVVAFDSRLPEGTRTAYSARRFAVDVEYGISDEITIFAGLPLRLVSVMRAENGTAEAFRQFDFGDARLGFRMALAERLGLPEASGLTVGLDLGVPLGYRRNVVPVIGSGQVDADLVVAYGHRFLGDALHAQVATGYRFRSGIFALSRRVSCPTDDEDALCFPLPEDLSFSDELLLRAEAGYAFFDRLVLSGLADVVWSVETPEAPSRFADVFQPELFTQRRRVALGGSLRGELFEGAVVSARLLAPVSGQNVVASPALSFAFEIRI